MNELLRSTFGVLALLAILSLTVVNTCQLDNLERQILTGAAVAPGRVQAAVATQAPGAASTEDWRGKPLSAEDQALLDDPRNLLKDWVRPWANGDTIVRGGTARIEAGQDPPGLNIYASNNANDMTEIYGYVTNWVGRRHPENPELHGPELAINVTEEVEGLVYTVHLRKRVFWHVPAVDWASGRYEWLKGPHEVTTDDFVFALETILNPQVTGRAASLRNYVEAFDHIEVIDKHTMKVHFKEKVFTNNDILLEIEPYPRWLYQYDEDGNKFDDATWGLKLNEHWYNQKAIGTGPYRFVSWEPGVRVVLEKNPDYWGEPASFDQIQYTIIKDQVSWPRKLKTGELDISRIQPEQYRTEVLEAKGPYLGNEHIKFTTIKETSYFYIGWNADRPYFNDTRVRKAMTLALNRPDIVNNVFHGLGPLTSGPFPQQAPCYDKSIKPLPFDLVEAARLLDEAGWKDTDGDGIRDRMEGGTKVPFEFTMVIYGNSTEWETLANIYREDLLSIGIKLNPSALEWSSLLKKMEDRDFDAYSGAWVPGWDADLMQLWHSSEADRPKSSNRIGFRNKDADRIAEALRREFDAEKRTALCHEFHALVHELQPYTFIYQRNRAVLYWDHLNEPEFSAVAPHRNARFFSFRDERP